ncbi:MAG: acyl-ACP--UDP-N-acetylglucosamine O-acyltransferase [Deltaproteobacteria bacterium]|nr:acyl-ACP--UDP-N-acetylglucosamine O-acyltransferase [Deltaproteobacteria bacterium]
MEIHPSAVVSPRAELGEGVRIGPYSVIGDNVKIGRETTIASHVVIDGHTTLGERNRIYPFVTIGSPPQDVGYRGEDTRLIIGDENIIREYATINRATTKEQWQTVIGDGNYIMAYAHIAHDCKLGNDIIMSNVATLGGHIIVGDHAILGGMVAVHQFVRIGPYAFLGGKSGVDRDVPPFMITAGPRAKLYGINGRGLKRHGFPQEKIEKLKKAYRIIWRDHRRLSEGIEQVKREIEPFPELELLLGFLDESKRGVLR